MTMRISAFFAASLCTIAAAQGPAPRTQVQQMPDSLVRFTMVRVPDGSITINGKTHQIRNLWVGQTEVTWNLADIFVFKQDMTQEQIAKGVDAQSRPSPPYGAPDRGFGHSGYAVISTHSNFAKNFAQWLAKRTGKPYRIPTEAEWEYAARANAPIPSDIGSVAWYKGNSEGKTHRVATRRPNAFGLHDMFGNAAEWIVMPNGEMVLAGGSFADPASAVGPSARARYSRKWQERDPQLPKSVWWLSDGPFAGIRIVMTGP